MDSFTIISDSSIYTNYVNFHLSINKLDGTNYDTLTSDIKLWLRVRGILIISPSVVLMLMKMRFTLVEN